MNLTSSAIVVAVSALVIAYFCHLNFKHPYDPIPSCGGGNELLECFFSDDYLQARDKFLQAAKNINCEIRKLKVTDEFSTDVAIHFGDTENVLIHISGTHGPEGFAGSAIQTAMLNQMHQKRSFDDKGFPTVVFIHALNPYGFAKNRRVNEDNIDLNRNFLTPEEFSFVKSRDPNFAGYLEVDYLLNPKQQPTKNSFINDIVGLWLSAYAALTVGPAGLKRTLVSGNYFKNEGVGFGGFELSRSARNLIHLISDLNIAATAKNIILVDVHTGLGPSGVDTLASNLKNASEWSEMAERVWPVERHEASGKVIGGLKEALRSNESAKSTTSALSGYGLTVGTMEDFCEHWLSSSSSSSTFPKHIICLTQEFGSVDMMTVGKALVDENYAHHHGTATEKLIYGDRLKNSFYVQTNSWRRSVVQRGITVATQALRSFGAKI